MEGRPRYQYSLTSRYFKFEKSCSSLNFPRIHSTSHYCFKRFSFITQARVFVEKWEDTNKHKEENTFIQASSSEC